MTTEHFTNLPRVAAMLILLAILLVLQRRQHRLAIGSWMLALGLILASQLTWYVTYYGTPSYTIAHTARLCLDMLTATAFTLFIGKPLASSTRRVVSLSWDAVPLLSLELLYGAGVVRPSPYIICAVAGAAVSCAVSLRLRRNWTIPLTSTILWAIIAIFATAGNDRAAAYFGLGYAFAVAAFHLWFRLRGGGIGRVVICISLGLWSLSYFLHPWIMHDKAMFSLANEVWSMQKYLITIGMLIVLLEESIRENERLALHDQLTGLPNRRLMEKRLTSAINLGVATVLLIDLDGFKNINDSYGHRAGDHLLQQMASRLSASLQKNETLARLGGDEFVFISASRGVELANVIEAAIAEPILLESGVEVALRSSVGFARYPDDAPGLTGAEAVSCLLNIADRSMYAVKGVGSRPIVAD